MEPSDGDDIRSCLNDHPEAFRHLVRRYEAPVTRYLRGRLGNADHAVEAAQETFVRAYFALSTLRKPEALLSWLLGIADRVARESRRAARQFRTVDLQEVEAAESRTATRDELAAAEAVARLPDAYREVVALRFYAGYSCTEISHHLGIPLGTVTKRLSRAYALLRERLRGQVGSTQSEVPR